MQRVVVISNRVALPHEVSAGGLVPSVYAALAQMGGLWFGWNGRITNQIEPLPSTCRHKNIVFSTVSLTEREYQGYYECFSNSVLWPLLHGFSNYVTFDRQNYEIYYQVNQRFAKHLVPQLYQNDLIWVHDYHLMPMAECLGKLGVTQLKGFFLHVPFPSHGVLRVLPSYHTLLKSLCHYDVIGFQAAEDRENFRECVKNCLGGCLGNPGTVEVFGKSIQTGVFPVGVEVDKLVAISQRSPGSTMRFPEIRPQRKWVVGADRLDYTKGLLQRMEAYEHFLKFPAETSEQVEFLQIAVPSRGKNPRYVILRQALEQLVGHLNGTYGDIGWMPIRYLEKAFSKIELLAMLRLARVGVVTPLCDGMNLVAKEFVVAQDPRDPGVLVLSEFAGAARELQAALLVHPYDVVAIARAIRRGLDMGLEERQNRHQRMMKVLRKQDHRSWYQRFTHMLGTRKSTHAVAEKDTA